MLKEFRVLVGEPLYVSVFCAFVVVASPLGHYRTGQALYLLFEITSYNRITDETRDGDLNSVNKYFLNHSLWQQFIEPCGL